MMSETGTDAGIATDVSGDTTAAIHPSVDANHGSVADDARDTSGDPLDMARVQHDNDISISNKMVDLMTKEDDDRIEREAARALKYHDSVSSIVRDNYSLSRMMIHLLAKMEVTVTFRRHSTTGESYDMPVKFTDGVVYPIDHLTAGMAMLLSRLDREVRELNHLRQDTHKLTVLSDERDAIIKSQTVELNKFRSMPPTAKLTGKSIVLMRTVERDGKESRKFLAKTSDNEDWYVTKSITSAAWFKTLHEAIKAHIEACDQNLDEVGTYIPVVIQAVTARVSDELTSEELSEYRRAVTNALTGQ